MITIKSKIDFPIITIMTAFLFLTSYCFKAGEAVYFGYPSYYISLDLPNVINLSLKLLIYFVFVFGAFIWLFDDSGNLKIKSVKYVIWLFCLIEVAQWFYKFHLGKRDYVSFLDGGLVAIFSFTMVYIAKYTFKKEDETVKVDVLALLATIMLASTSSFLAGINYHNQLGSTLWKTVDNKYVIGEYKDSFILKECVNGEGIFTLKEIKGNEFKETSVDDSVSSNFRCKKKI